MTSSEAAGMIFGLSMIAIALIALVLYVLLIIAYWKIFTKAGEPGWKAIIPLYNTYTQFKFSWNTSMFWVFLALSVVYGICSNITDSGIASFVALIAIVACAVIDIIALNKLSKCMGKGAGFTVGLVVLPTIFYLILGFGSSRYIGKQD